VLQHNFREYEWEVMLEHDCQFSGHEPIGPQQFSLNRPYLSIELTRAGTLGPTADSEELRQIMKGLLSSFSKTQRN
jgi:hypothetical protein